MKYNIINRAIIVTKFWFLMLVASTLYVAHPTNIKYGDESIPIEQPRATISGALNFMRTSILLLLLLLMKRVP